MFQLRYLHTLNVISAEKNSTIVFPIPVDIISHLMQSKSWQTKEVNVWCYTYLVKNVTLDIYVIIEKIDLCSLNFTLMVVVFFYRFKDMIGGRRQS